MATKSQTLMKRYVSESGLHPNYKSVENFLFTLVGSRTGVANPNWRSQIRSGTNASTAFSASVTLQKIDPVDWSLSFRFNGVTYKAFVNNMMYNESYPSLITAHIGDMSDLVVEANAIAIKSLYKKLRKVHSQFSGGIVLGELRKTLMMITNPAKSLRDQVTKYSRSAQAIRKGGRGASMTSSSRKGLSGLYLEAVFGWQPLLHDIRDGAEALARLVKDNTPQRFRAFGEKKKILSSDTGEQFAHGLWNYGFKTEVSQTVLVVFYGAFRDSAMSSMAESSIQRVIDLSGFNLRDFLPTVWELIPYSFLVDYFTNIGDLIEAAGTDTSTVARLTKVTIKETSRKVRITNLRDKNQSYWISPGRVFLGQTSSNGGHEVTFRDVLREPTSVPFMVPRFEKPDLFSKQSLNIGALISAR